MTFLWACVHNLYRSCCANEVNEFHRFCKAFVREVKHLHGLTVTCNSADIAKKAVAEIARKKHHLTRVRVNSEVYPNCEVCSLCSILKTNESQSTHRRASSNLSEEQRELVRLADGDSVIASSVTKGFN